MLFPNNAYHCHIAKALIPFFQYFKQGPHYKNPEQAPTYVFNVYDFLNSVQLTTINTDTSLTTLPRKGHVNTDLKHFKIALFPGLCLHTVDISHAKLTGSKEFVVFSQSKKFTLGHKDKQRSIFSMLPRRPNTDAGRQFDLDEIMNSFNEKYASQDTNATQTVEILASLSQEEDSDLSTSPVVDRKRRHLPTPSPDRRHRNKRRPTPRVIPFPLLSDSDSAFVPDSLEDDSDRSNVGSPDSADSGHLSSSLSDSEDSFMKENEDQNSPRRNNNRKIEAEEHQVSEIKFGSRR